MSTLSFRSFTFMLFIAFLVWSSHIDTCCARRGKHWRQSRAASLYKKRVRSHGSGHHHGNAGKSKHKSPSPKPPTPLPSPKAPSPPAPGRRPGHPSPSPKPPTPLPSPKPPTPLPSPKAPSPPAPGRRPGHPSPSPKPPTPLPSPKAPSPPAPGRRPGHPSPSPKPPTPLPSPKPPTPLPSPKAPSPPAPGRRPGHPSPSPKPPTPLPSPKAPSPPAPTPLPSPKAPSPPAPGHRPGHPSPSPKPPTPLPSPKAPSPPAPGHRPGHPSAPPKKGYNSPSTVFNVVDFGAKGDGTSDDTKAFEAAWAAACRVEASMILVPSKFTFLVGPISFSGPYCKPNIVFQLDGTIIAPTSSEAWGSGLFQWLQFTKLIGITIQGSGTIDGRGSVWWQDSQYDDPIDDESKLIVPLNSTVQENKLVPIGSSLGGKMPSIKPTALRFYGSFNVTVTGIKIQNSPQCHLKFDNCKGVSVFGMSTLSPGDSPNTDGIHLQNSQDVLIRSVNLACGDDCVSIQTGCTNVYIHNVNCGPGHGISIGGLGKDGTKACVSNITVRDINMHNTMTGVRIKTWQGGLGSVQGVLFSNIQVSEVELPIVIDQYYCDKRKCDNQTSAVAVSGITYENIRGTYTVKPAHLACSDNLPCFDVILTDIELKPIQERYHMFNPFCWQTFGELNSPTEPPINCLQVGKPSGNRIQTAYDSC